MRYGPARRSAARRKMVARSRQAMRDHSRCATSAASIACATSAAPPLCQTARTWRWSCGMTTSAVRPVATPRPPMRGVISTTSLDILASWARKALRSGLPGAYARMGSLRGGGTETIAFGMSSSLRYLIVSRGGLSAAYDPRRRRPPLRGLALRQTERPALGRVVLALRRLRHPVLAVLRHAVLGVARRRGAAGGDEHGEGERDATAHSAALLWPATYSATTGTDCGSIEVKLSPAFAPRRQTIVPSATTGMASAPPSR